MRALPVKSQTAGLAKLERSKFLFLYDKLGACGVWVDAGRATIKKPSFWLKVNQKISLVLEGATEVNWLQSGRETGVKVDSASRVNIWRRKCTACWTEQSGLVVVKSQFCEESSQWYCVKELVF